MTIRFTFAVALLVLCTSSLRAGEPDAFSDYMDALVDVRQFNGSVLVTKDDETVFSGCYGMANFEHHVANTPTTKFRIGSITKQFTAMCVLLLQDQGKLKTSDAISTHLHDAPEHWSGITVHHLLTHTSGIASFTGMPEYDRDMMLPQSVEQMIARFRDKPLEFEPGKKFNYSNSGYYLLGAVIESASGQSYQDFLRSAVLDPLKLSDTGYDTFGAILPERATGYEREGGSLRHADYLDMSQPYSAGAMYSTVSDLTRWDAALRNRKLLSAEGYEAFYRPEKDDYAYGWRVEVKNGRKEISHGGGINGFSSYLLRIPEESLCVAVISNVLPARCSIPGKDLAAIALGEDYELPQAKPIAAVDPKRLKRLAGDYAMEESDLVATIEAIEDHVLLKAVGRPTLKMMPCSENEFFHAATGLELSFVIEDDLAKAFVLNTGDRTLRGNRVDADKAESDADKSNATENASL